MVYFRMLTWSRLERDIETFIEQVEWYVHILPLNDKNLHHVFQLLNINVYRIFPFVIMSIQRTSFASCSHSLIKSLVWSETVKESF